jgi:hypothetical protein
MDKNLNEVKDIVSGIEKKLSFLDFDALLLLEALIREEKKSRPDEKYY